jgi:hypothetical protein
MKQHPTKEQWQEVEAGMSSIWVTVYLRCDGYLVMATLVRVSVSKLEVHVFVDGFLKGAWILPKDGVYPDQAVRFYRPVDKLRYPPKFVKQMEKAIGKRRCQAEGYYDKRRYYQPTWGTPAAFLRHLKKHNEHIEVIDRETHDRELADKEAKVNVMADLLNDA